MATSAEIQTMIDELLAQQQKVALGQAVAEVWRGDRKVKYQIASMGDFNAYLRELNDMLRAALIAEGVTVPRRRRAVRLGWR